ncbi:50S ribosomal protein L25, partial [Candidatus Omnitrophota bacterium]
MEDISLEAQVRDGIGRVKVKDLRGKGFLPAVVYGGKKETTAISVSRHELLRLLHEHGLENMVIKLKVKDAKVKDDKKKARPCLIKEIQYDPVSGDMIHLDFIEISLTETIKVNVPVKPKGEPIGVKQEGGSLETILWEIEVECLPTNIPKDVEIDVANMKMGDSLHVKDIVFPVGIKILADPEAVVLSVA